MRRSPLGPLLLLAACREEQPAPPGFQLRAVVAPALQALEAQAGEPAAEPAVTGAPDGVLERILGPLRAADPDLRALAIEDARSLAPAEVLQLVPALRDERERAETRAAVVEILAAHATRAAVEALCDAAESASEPWLRSQCAYRLGRVGRDFVLLRLLVRLKYEKDYETAFWLADACSRFGHLAGLEAMFVIWNGTQDENLRALVSRRTSELAAERGVGDADELLARWKAGTLAPPPTPFEPGPRLRLEAWRRIRDLGEWNLRTVDDARYALSHCEGWVVPLLEDALHEEAVYVRMHAAQCLERMGPRAARAVPALIAALEEPRAAPAVAAALGAIGEPSAAAALERRLAESADPELRVAALVALGTLGAPSSIPYLRATFDPAEPLDVRQAAAAGLARLDGSPDALAFLRACLTGGDGDAGAAESALGAWLDARDDPAALAALERWRALEPPSGALPGEDELSRRRAERAALVDELLARDSSERPR